MSAGTGWAEGATVLTRLEGDVVECKILKVEGIGLSADLTLQPTAEPLAAPLTRTGGDCELCDSRKLSQVHDLATLDQLSEASMLQCLRLRYYDKVNPYEDLKQVYDLRMMEKVKAADEVTLLTLPHPYALAEGALRGLLRDSKSQSILISGESGAGKTESVKYAMRYLALRSRSGSKSSIDELVLATNPILEAFANAKTTRNDNSSRFGKYIQVFIEPVSASITSATISSYLLEKARVVEQNPGAWSLRLCMNEGVVEGERNYHGFYQVVKHAQTPLCASEKGDPWKFAILTKGQMVECSERNTWVDTRKALSALGISKTLLADMEAVLESILALGDLEFDALEIKGQDDGSSLREKKRNVSAASLLGVTREALSEALCARIVAKVRVPNNADAARHARDGLSKSMYERMFEWVVAKINESLGKDPANAAAAAMIMPPVGGGAAGGGSLAVMKRQNSANKNSANKGSSSSPMSPVRRQNSSKRRQSFSAAVMAGGALDASADEPLFVGLLDIFGFEHFKSNSLEQLLINYANERLQAHFNGVVFANEAREYAAEGIPISAVEYIDNSGVVLCIEKGILAVLDEECSLKNPSDLSFVARVKAGSAYPKEMFPIRLNRHSSAMDRELVGGKGFGVRHFANDVTYDARGFVTKNLDALPQDLLALCAHSSVALVAQLFHDGKAGAADEGGGGARGARGAKKTMKQKFVTKSFVTNLTQLITLLNATSPSFVRCVKPNMQMKASKFEGAKVLEQLTAMGVLQVVEARRKGYAFRYLHSAFQERFAIICADGGKAAVSSSSAVAAEVIALLALPVSAMIVGKTKTFIKANAHGHLEAARDKALTTMAYSALAETSGSVEALEEALKVATVLRLKGAVVVQARCRLAQLRFDEEVRDIEALLDSAEREAYDVDQLSDLLLEVNLDLVEEAQHHALNPDQATQWRSALVSLQGRVGTMQRRVAAQGAAAKASALVRDQLARDSSTRTMLSTLDAALADTSDDAHQGSPEYVDLLDLRAHVQTNIEASERAAKAASVAEAQRKKEADEAEKKRKKEEKKAKKKEEKKKAKKMAKGVRAPGEAPEDSEDDDDNTTKNGGGTRMSRRNSATSSAAAAAAYLPAAIKRRPSVLAISDPNNAKTSVPPPVPPATPPPKVHRAPEYCDKGELACAKDMFDKDDFKRVPCVADLVEQDVHQRRELLKQEVAVVKLSSKEKKGQQVGAEWKLLRLSDDGRVVWGASEKRICVGALTARVSAKRSDGVAGVGLERIIEVRIGPRKMGGPKGGGGAPDIVLEHQQYTAAGKSMPSKWHYLTLATREREYHFGFTSEVDLLVWAVTLERLSDTAQLRERRFGDGVLSRTQRTFVDDVDFGKRSDLPFLCPVLRPLAWVLHAVCSQRPLGGAFFGSKAPDALKVKLSWVGCAVIDALEERGVGIVRDIDVQHKEFDLWSLGAGELYLVRDRTQPAAVQRAVAWIAAHTERRSTPKLLNGKKSSANNGNGNGGAGGAVPNGRTAKLRPSATREVPKRPCVADLYAACAKADVDLVEALVLRCRLRVDARYKPDDRGPTTWVDRVGEPLAYMEPQTNTTPLNFVVTWCDVLGEAVAEKVIRRLLMLRADTALDDAHPEVRFPPLCAAVANSSVRIALTLLHAGADPDAITGDGRSSLHILQLASQPNIKALLLHALVSAGADVNFQVEHTGDTPLHIAANDGAFDVVAALIEAGANPQIENLEGLTPSESAMLELHLLDDNNKDNADPDLLAKIDQLRSCIELLG